MDKDSKKLLKKLLKNVPDTYPDFELDVETDCEENDKISNQMIEYMQNNPNATSSDVLEHLTSLEDLPEIQFVDDEELDEDEK